MRIHWTELNLMSLKKFTFWSWWGSLEEEEDLGISGCLSTWFLGNLLFFRFRMDTANGWSSLVEGQSQWWPSKQSFGSSLGSGFIRFIIRFRVGTFIILQFISNSHVKGKRKKEIKSPLLDLLFSKNTFFKKKSRKKEKWGKRIQKLSSFNNLSVFQIVFKGSDFFKDLLGNGKAIAEWWRCYRNWVG